jgi:peptidoglycan/xylan/chitin deacetylase (PgdA/CDA1 family)
MARYRHNRKKDALHVSAMKRFSAIVWLSFFLATLSIVIPNRDTSSVPPIRIPKSFAQDIPDGENIAPTSQELFTNDALTGMQAIPYTTDSVILHGPRDEKTIALTFDADMTPFMKAAVENKFVSESFDRRIVSILEKTQTKATFFLTGMWVEMYRSDVEKLAQNPLFAFGNHSYSHPSFEGGCFGLQLIPDSEDITQVTKTNELLKQTTGENTTLFRFPGGCYGQTDLSIITSYAHMAVVHWDVVGNDGFNNDVSQIERNVLNHTQNGSIIVLHMNGAPNAPRTADALPTIISTLKDRGYTFVTVGELLHLPSPENLN